LQIDILRVYQRSRREAIVGTVAALAATGTLWFEIASLKLPYWCGATLICYMLRDVLISRTKRSIAEGGDGKRLSLLLLIAFAVTGSFWGGLGAWIAVSEISQLITFTLLFWLAFFSLLLLINYQGIISTLPFIIPALSAPIIGCVASLEVARIVAAIFLLLSGSLIVVLARMFDALNIQASALDTDKDDLASKLKLRAEEIKKLKASAKAHLQKQQELETQLQTARSDMAVLQGKVTALTEALSRLSPIDSTTDLANKQRFDEVLKTEWARMLRTEGPITLVHLRIDEFEEYQSSYNTRARDECLKQVAAAIKSCGNRPSDCAARIGTKDFALLLVGADSGNGARIADQARERVFKLGLPNRYSNFGKITVSIGVNTLTPQSGLALEELVEGAESALHEAEFRGGNFSVRYRTMKDIHIEHWNPASDGDLSEQALLQKIAGRGYAQAKKRETDGIYMTDQRRARDSAIAIINGHLQLSLGGESATLKPGDCWFIPKNVEVSAECVKGDKVVFMEAAIHEKKSS